MTTPMKEGKKDCCKSTLNLKRTHALGGEAAESGGGWETSQRFSFFT